MARKVRRPYFPVRRSSGRARGDDAERQDRTDTAAHQLASRHTLDELRLLLADRTALFQQADQEGTSDPGPVNLARYRAARADWEVARRAVELANRESPPAP